MTIIYALYKTHIAARNGAPDEIYLVPTEKGVMKVGGKVIVVPAREG